MNSRGNFASARAGMMALLAILACPALGQPGPPRAPANVRISASVSDLNGTLRVVTGDAPGRSVSGYIGKIVRSGEGQELGTIKDVAVDAYSGRIVYAVVAARAGGTLRLVPFAALQSETGTSNALSVEIAQPQWEQVSPINADDFASGRITLTESERRLLVERFGRKEPAPPTEEPRLPRRDAGTASDVTTPSGGSQLVALGELRGKKVSTGSEHAGTISDVIIDAERMTGAAIVAPETDLAAAHQRFVVPLRQLNLASRDQNPITTRLTREDFEKARAGESVKGRTR